MRLPVQLQRAMAAEAEAAREARAKVTQLLQGFITTSNSKELAQRSRALRSNSSRLSLEDPGSNPALDEIYTFENK